jgi:hypothetical protein
MAVVVQAAAMPSRAQWIHLKVEEREWLKSARRRRRDGSGENQKGHTG